VLRRSIGYVIQEVGLLPHLTVAANVGIVPRLLGWDEERRRARARELLTLVGLDPDRFGPALPRQLSGGERQRAGLARALGADPPLLLMDEPFGALDPLTRRRLQDEFKALQKQLGKTVVLVTHDVPEALRLGDRVAVMHAGRVVQDGTAAEIRDHPEAGFVRDFLDAALP
jgi:osmoprotectant transport system ATP-binding protein